MNTTCWIPHTSFIGVEPIRWSMQIAVSVTRVFVDGKSKPEYCWIARIGNAASSGFKDSLPEAQEAAQTWIVNQLTAQAIAGQLAAVKAGEQ